MSAFPARTPRPFLPSELTRERPGTLISRAAFCVARSGPSHLPEQVAREKWPGDERTLAVVKATTSPAAVGTSGWASQLAPAALADFLGSLQPQSAAAKLVAAGTQLSLNGVASLGIPQRSTVPATDAAWVSETGAIPVRQSTVAETFLGPAKKLAAIAVLSRETAEHSSGESVISAILSEDISASLDATLFSNLAATSARPAGLLNGVSAAATATTGGGEAALRGDLDALAGAVANSGGVDGIVFIASPAYALRTSLYRTTTQGLNIWAAAPGAVADGTIIAIQSRAFVSAFPGIRIETANNATLHMEDTSPLALSATGTPNTVAAPIRSLWQTDSIAIRAILSIAYTTRAPHAVSFITKATW
jgi:hypothetical protein